MDLRIMDVTHRFVADPEQTSDVIAWFRSMKTAPTEVPTERSTVLYFKEFGPLIYSDDGQVESTQSPIVTIFLP